MEWLIQSSLEPVPTCISLSQIVQWHASVLWLGQYLRVQFALVHFPAWSLSFLSHSLAEELSSLCAKPILGHLLGEHIFVCLFFSWTREEGSKSVQLEWSFVLCWGNERLRSCLAWHKNVSFHRTESFGLRSLTWWGKRRAAFTRVPEQRNTRYMQRLETLSGRWWIIVSAGESF